MFEELWAARVEECLLVFFFSFFLNAFAAHALSFPSYIRVFPGRVGMKMKKKNLTCVCKTKQSVLAPIIDIEVCV